MCIYMYMTLYVCIKAPDSVMLSTQNFHIPQSPPDAYINNTFQSL